MRPIDADKLLKDIEQYHLSDGFFQHWVEVQPTIEGRKKGRWLNKGGKICCSVCGRTNFLAPNFCPDCGSEMI